MIILKRMICIGVLLLSSLCGYTCDVCGSGGSSILLGVKADFLNNYLRLGYNSSVFNAHESVGYPVTDNFGRIDLSSSLAFGANKNWRFTAHLPYVNNTRQLDNSNTTLNGLGDIRLFIGYRLMSENASERSFSITANFDMGVILPTGDYDPNIHDNNLPENFNLGRGSYAWVPQMNAIFSFNAININVSTAYQSLFESNSGYKYGNQVTSQVALSKELKLGEFSLIPAAGLFFENINQDTYANQKTVEGTGGSGWFSNLNLNLQMKSFMIGVSYALPIAEEYSSNIIIARNRMNISGSYYF